MARVDLVVSFLSGVPADIVPKFNRRLLNVVVNLGTDDAYKSWWKTNADASGNVFPSVFQKFGGGLPAGSTLGRVCVMGFSRGGIGARETMRAHDAGNVDALLIFDGIHGSYVDPTQKLLYAPQYEPIIATGIAAAQNASGSPLCMITHSSIVPPGFPSTTETANLIWDEVLKRAPANYESTYWADLDNVMFPGDSGTIVDGSFGPVTWSGFADGWYDRRNANNFSVFGWGDPGPDGVPRVRDVRGGGHVDHLEIAQKILPAILEYYLARRWNDAGSVSGLGADEGSGAQEYDAKPPTPLVDPGGLATYIPKIAGGCLYPPPGQVIVGSKSNPCATVPGDIPPPPKPSGSAGSSTFATWFAAGAGFVAGYYGLEWYQRARR